MEHGILASDVKCEAGFILILRVSDKSAACVTIASAQILIERGWGTKVQGTSVSIQSASNTTNISKPTPIPNGLKFASTLFNWRELLCLQLGI
jgi:hypothetical protein